MSGYDSPRGDQEPAHKRRRSRSPYRNGHSNSSSYRNSRDGTPTQRDHEPSSRPRWSHKDQMRTNALQEEERMRKWVAQEDDFVLKQAKKKAEIRVREGRAKPIDWLAVTLRMIDDTRKSDQPSLDDDVPDEDLEFVDPDTVFDGLDEKEFEELRKDIETYEKLESSRQNREYWRTMQIICKYRRRKMGAGGLEGRATGNVSADIDRLLSPKTYDELEALEKQIRAKLKSNEPIDTDYWQQLLDSLLVWKAKAKLRHVYEKILEKRMEQLRRESEAEAIQAREELAQSTTEDVSSRSLEYSKALDPDSRLEIPSKDKTLEVLDEKAFLSQLASKRARTKRMGYVPLPHGSKSKATTSSAAIASKPTSSSTNGPSQFDRDVARGVDEDEEVFAAEEPTAAPSSTGLRKPRYFNRVQLGYEWNKYNQTHYTADAPPPKVVQGYRFHIFYPDLPPTNIKAPTYKIIREDGRKKGQTLAPAGEEDTCIIRFVSPGPPYEDVAFRIVDRDWDYSAKYERGFKSVFEGGVLSLHFSFKKVFYRK